MEDGQRGMESMEWDVKIEDFCANRKRKRKIENEGGNGMGYMEDGE